MTMIGMNALKSKLVVVIFMAAAGFGSVASAATPDGALKEVQRLAPMWRANAPLCFEAPSAQDCRDGDMTLFNGLLCAAGDQLGCDGVRNAQDSSGRWHRSVRYRQHPELRPYNSFSWDMALGVQLYAVTTKDKRALESWLEWVENNRPCLSKISVSGRDYCLVRGLPRWCTDDTEKGCTAKPQGLAILYRTARYLGAATPAPAETTPPSGLPGEVVRLAIEQTREANAALSLQRLFESTKDIQPWLILIDAAVNREGFPRHLTATEIMLYRMTGGTTEDVDYAAAILARREPHNAFFSYLVNGPSEEVAQKVLALAPKSEEELPEQRGDWTWQRAESDQAWKRAKLWDFVFMAHLLKQ